MYLSSIKSGRFKSMRKCNDFPIYKENDKCNINCNRYITRRSLIHLACSVIGLIGFSSILQRCIKIKTNDPDTTPAENPARFSKQVRHYYSEREENLMDEYDKLSYLFSEYLIKQNYDERKIDLWLKQSRLNYKQLIPELPYVGGDKNDLTRILLSTSAFIPLVKVLRNEGLSTRQIGQMMVTAASDMYQKRIPWFVKRYLRGNYFSDSGKQKKKTAALFSQKKRYPGDWVFSYREGDGSTYDYEIIYSECALKKIWALQDLEEYVPYLCLCDYAIWKAVGIEVKRTKTLGNGASECDFKYIKKGPNVPPPLPPESHPEWTGRFEN
jgi:hypothetical protein